MFQSYRISFFLMQCSLCLCLSFIILPALVSADSRPTVVCYENLDYVPFMLGEKKVPEQKPGILLELLDIAAPDVNIEYQRKPWKRCIKQLQLGRVDALFAAIWLPERDSWGQFPPLNKRTGVAADSRYRLWHVQYQIFVNRASGLNWDGKNFHGLKRGGISAPPGYVAKKKLKGMGVLAKGSHIPLEGFKLVALDRLDGYVIEKHIGIQTVFRMPRELQDRIFYLDTPLFDADWHIVFSHQYMKHHADKAQKIWEGLANISEDNRQAIVERYAETFYSVPDSSIPD